MNTDDAPFHRKGNAEREGVEKPAIAWLQQLGYTHRSGKAVGKQQPHRHLPPILTDVLTDRLLSFNPVAGGCDCRCRYRTS